jgi:uncharacterized protein (TIGR02246 family)
MHISKTGLAVATLIVAGVVADIARPHPSAQDLEDAIAAANDAFMEAFARGDAAAVAALYTEDARLLPPGSDPVDGRAAIEAFWQSVMDSGVAKATFATDEVEGVGDTAYEVSRYTMYDADGSMIGEGNYIVIWKRTDVGWKLHRDIWN